MNLKSITIRDKTYLFFFILPAAVLIFTFFILPNLFNFYYSFTDWSSYKSEINFIGLSNFKKLFYDKAIIKDIITTIKYSAIVATLQNGVALILALALERTTRLNTVFRTFFYMPILFSTLAAGYIFKGIYRTDGLLNKFLSFITGSEINFGYLGSVTFTIFFLAVIHAWRYSSISLIVYIAGLTTIPEELIESARLEGASYLRVVKDIKLPLLGPAFTFNIAGSLIGSLSTIEVVLSVTKGGPAKSTEVLNMLIFREFGTGKYGNAVAISLFLFLVVCVLGYPLVIYLRKREVEL